jgi:hypothetical protein
MWSLTSKICAFNQQKLVFDVVKNGDWANVALWTFLDVPKSEGYKFARVYVQSHQQTLSVVDSIW